MNLPVILLCIILVLVYMLLKRAQLLLFLYHHHLHHLHHHLLGVQSLLLSFLPSWMVKGNHKREGHSSRFAICISSHFLSFLRLHTPFWGAAFLSGEQLHIFLIYFLELLFSTLMFSRMVR